MLHLVKYIINFSPMPNCDNIVFQTYIPADMSGKGSLVILTI